jgi:hypothetical protein
MARGPSASPNGNPPTSGKLGTSRWLNAIGRKTPQPLAGCAAPECRFQRESGRGAEPLHRVVGRDFNAVRTLLATEFKRTLGRMARDWESWLASASGPASPTEEEERDRTESRIRDAIRAAEDLPSSVSVYAKGSYANNTNVRRNGRRGSRRVDGDVQGEAVG